MKICIPTFFFHFLTTPAFSQLWYWFPLPLVGGETSEMWIFEERRRRHDDDAETWRKWENRRGVTMSGREFFFWREMEGIEEMRGKYVMVRRCGCDSCHIPKKHFYTDRIISLIPLTHYYTEDWSNNFSNKRSQLHQSISIKRTVQIRKRFWTSLEWAYRNFIL